MLLRASILVAAVALGVGCAAGGAPAPAASLGQRVANAEAAKKIAIEAAAKGGYPPDVYVVRAVDWVSEGSRAGTWAVSFEHVPPAPPGGHCLVFVRASDGATDLRRGE